MKSDFTDESFINIPVEKCLYFDHGFKWYNIDNFDWIPMVSKEDDDIYLTTRRSVQQYFFS